RVRRAQRNVGMREEDRAGDQRTDRAREQNGLGRFLAVEHLTTPCFWDRKCAETPQFPLKLRRSIQLKCRRNFLIRQTARTWHGEFPAKTPGGILRASAESRASFARMRLLMPAPGGADDRFKLRLRRRKAKPLLGAARISNQHWRITRTARRYACANVDP